MAPVLVAEVFKSPMVDYRVVALGAVLPLVEVAVGRPWMLHSLAGSVLALALVMLTTINRRLVRRRLLGLPIGMFLHLVLDGAWSGADLFWWPLFGSTLEGQGLPEAGLIPLRLLLEVAAVGVGIWAMRRYGLNTPEARARLLRTGHLTRSALPGYTPQS